MRSPEAEEIASIPAVVEAASKTIPPGSLAGDSARRRVRGSRYTPATIARRPTGTLRKNTQRQPTAATSSPPVTGPDASPMACADAWTPSAARRFSTGTAGSVRPAADGHEERRQRQQVSEGDPLHGRQAGVELPLQRGKRHGDDARVQLTHEGAEAHRTYREPWCEAMLANNRRPGRLTQQGHHEMVTTSDSHRGRVQPSSPLPNYI